MKLVVGERDISLKKEEMTFFLSPRPGDAISGWVSTLIDSSLSLKNQKMVCSLVQ